MKTLVDCGCEVRVHADGSGAEIDYCPLHAAAGEMLKALSEAAEVLAIGAAPPKQHGPFTSWVERPGAAEKRVRAVIFKAERRSAATIFRLAAMDEEG